MERRLKGRWLFPLALATFTVVFLTGLLMLCHFRSGPLEMMHQGIGLVFAMTVVIHLALNRHLLASIFKPESATLVIAAVIILALLFMVRGIYHDHDLSPVAREHGVRAPARP